MVNFLKSNRIEDLENFDTASSKSYQAYHTKHLEHDNIKKVTEWTPYKK